MPLFNEMYIARNTAAFFAVLFLVLGVSMVAYQLQRWKTRREMETITRREQELYLRIKKEMRALEDLRLAQHDAKNELLVLQGFLERGEPDAARRYLDALLARQQELERQEPPSGPADSMK